LEKGVIFESHRQYGEERKREEKLFCDAGKKTAYSGVKKEDAGTKHREECLVSLFAFDQWRDRAEGKKGRGGQGFGKGATPRGTSLPSANRAPTKSCSPHLHVARGVGEGGGKARTQKLTVKVLGNGWPIRTHAKGQGGLFESAFLVLPSEGKRGKGHRTSGSNGTPTTKASRRWQFQAVFRATTGGGKKNSRSQNDLRI